MPQREGKMFANKKAKRPGDGLILNPKESGLTVLLKLNASSLAAVVALTVLRVYFVG
jgi:hypothetical protein